MPNPFRNRLKQEIGETNLPLAEETERLPVARDDYLIKALGRTDLTEGQVSTLKNYAKDMRAGNSAAYSAPITCLGNECAYEHKCPVSKAGVTLPVGRLCPVESSLIQWWRDDMCDSLGIDPNADDTDAFDRKLLEELARIQLIKMRLDIELALEPKLMQDVAINVDANGQVIEKVQANPLIMVYEKLVKVEMKIMRELIATRKAQADAHRTLKDPSKEAAEILQKLRTAERERRAKIEEPTIEATFEVKD